MELKNINLDNVKKQILDKEKYRNLGKIKQRPDRVEGRYII